MQQHSISSSRSCSSRAGGGRGRHPSPLGGGEAPLRPGGDTTALDPKKHKYFENKSSRGSLSLTHTPIYIYIYIIQVAAKCVFCRISAFDKVLYLMRAWSFFLLFTVTNHDYFLSPSPVPDQPISGFLLFNQRRSQFSLRPTIFLRNLDTERGGLVS